MNAQFLASADRSSAWLTKLIFWMGTTVLALLLAGPAAAQASFADRAASYEAQKTMTISTIRFPETKAATLNFIRRRATQLQKQEETPEQLVAEFSLPLSAVPALDSLVGTFGYVQENNLNRRNQEPRLEEQKSEVRADSLRLVRLQEKLLLAEPSSAKALELQTQIDANEAALRRQRLDRSRYAQHEGHAYVTLRLFDEVSFPVANRKVNFVNMPGVEFGYLFVANPKLGLSAARYQGYSIKYLVTRGKSYFNLGIYKPVSPRAEPSDSSFINEMAVINFGQDFYPRNFGRGKRRFCNLYTSYQLGGFIANRQGARSEFIPNLNLGMGVEVVKTKHVLLDLKGSYFVPLHGDSRSLRGVLAQGAFNFVF
ncbi:hypothetical protein Q5H93_16810 [Hymenobacter sp. ASUV-10]|uniref:Outer membrane protein beta-barrel domain-containing protein n=1 Tax=Hymenobacter aranciens TaxID=3063996 RepID=A0ABT9BDW7_9BACT|nr:hypothetical protein [Hymenobacter sp. ASUV-10]MDO7876407.1 hypothetical protein [Hymenobacter sp. ASUV-10]